MNLKTKWTLLCLILVLFSISAVSASDDNLTDVVELADEVQVDSVGVEVSENVTGDEADGNLSASSEEVIDTLSTNINETDSLKSTVSVESNNVLRSPNKNNAVAATSKKKAGFASVRYAIAKGTYYQAYLKGADGKPIPNVPVTMTIKGKDYKVTTDSLGLAKLKINLPYGKYGIKLTFNGNSRYYDVTKSFNFFVGKKTFVVIQNDKLFTNGYLRVYLRGDSFSYVANKTLKISVGTKKFTKVTNSEGMVVFKPNAGKGFRKVSVTFDGTFNIVGSHAEKRVAGLLGNAKNPLQFKLPIKDGVPDVDYMVGNYVMANGNAKYTILKSQYLQVIQRDSRSLFLFNKLTKYTFFKSKSEPKYNQLIHRAKWNVIEREIYKIVVPQNQYNYWPDQITVSLKGKTLTYSAVRDTQDTGYTCGPTSASMCTQVLRNYVNEHYLAVKSGSDAYSGSSTSGLKAGLESFNMKCTYYYKSSFKMALNELKKGGCALIFHTWGHYVAILDISKDGSKVLVGNPSGDYDHGSHDIPTNWLTVDYMYSVFNDYDTSGLIVRLGYSLSKSTVKQLNMFYNNMGTYDNHNTNERIPNLG